MKKIYLILLMFATVSVQAQSYAEWKQSRQEGYKVYAQNYLARYAGYQEKVTKQWGDYARMSSAHDYVLYKEDLHQRVVLDYEHNQILIESLNGKDLDVKQALTELAETSVGGALSNDPVLSNVKGQKQAESLLHTITGTDDVAEVMSKVDVAQADIGDATSKRIQQVKISLPTQMVRDRAAPFVPTATKMSEEFSVDRSLILAVAQTESSFNPLAQSPIPAFGLMQIVPNSAGKDVNVKINNKNQSPDEETLFQPDENIRFGAAYLHILDSRYLKDIKNEKSRLYCTIAAYNTGAGNVASVFHPDNKRSLSLAVEEINKLSPEQVYQKLERELPYQETRTYLKKVTTALGQYQQLEVANKAQASAL
ncbi:murein transglycosylase domain-containing protein [Marinomonas pollencensis]|uniref:Membrane-bound lytic murein transglycosylase C n=1 Tax=Marinomonas pollencensis TaxID=491954 RepID=A0A3E0DTP9_9GAMM|nr:murein transglycosylase domain-containing protein [Marinomonas pollencensis]REG85886.1 membrane-bound lytic murein transglycosylase C [Marinomonas pollencensis]